MLVCLRILKNHSAAMDEGGMHSAFLSTHSHGLEPGKAGKGLP